MEGIYDTSALPATVLVPGHYKSGNSTSLTSIYLILNMPRALAVYNAIPTSETVQFQLPSGEGKQFVVWKDIDSEAKLVKCDLCDRLMPLQGQSKIGRAHV